MLRHTRHCFLISLANVGTNIYVTFYIALFIDGFSLSAPTFVASLFIAGGVAA